MYALKKIQGAKIGRKWSNIRQRRGVRGVLIPHIFPTKLVIAWARSTGAAELQTKGGSDIFVAAAATCRCGMLDAIQVTKIESFRQYAPVGVAPRPPCGPTSNHWKAWFVLLQREGA